MDGPRLPERRPLLVVAEAASGFEEAILRDWAMGQGVPATSIILIPSARRSRFARRTSISPLLDARISRDPDLLVVPARVVWRAPERDGVRQVGILDVVKAAGDPRDPAWAHQRWVAARHPDRMVIVVGDPADAGTLVTEWRGSQAASRLGDWVANRAWLALERAERRLRGNRYKVARFVGEAITADGAFQAGLAEIAESTDTPYEKVSRRASRLLDEIAARPTSTGIDLIAGLIHLLYRQGYGRIWYDRDHLIETYRAAERASLVFLPSHKSQLDRLVMQYVLWENDLPPSHTAGGINLDFWPVGPLVRRTGVFFIRRSFKGDPTYRYVLRSYLDHLLARRFPMEWYLEGGRSRTGKLRAPSFGLLSYVVDSFERGVTDDVILVPTSISYDQIQDIGDYAAESTGGAKVDESFGWMLGAVRKLRRRHGDVHVRLGAPISLAETWKGASEEGSIDIARLGFDVMTRINDVTPITPTSVVSLVMTSHPGPHGSEALASLVLPLAREVDRLGLPRTARFDRVDDIDIVLDRMAEHGFVDREDDGWVVAAGQAHPLAFFRNTMVHHLLVAAIVDVARHQGGDVEEQALRVRDLLKFDFFFEGRDDFLGSLAGASLTADHVPGLGRMVLEPFFETYWATADASRGQDEFPTPKAVLAHTERLLGRDRLSRPEAASLPIIESALRLLEHLGIEGDQSAIDALADELGSLLDACRPQPEDSVLR